MKRCQLYLFRPAALALSLAFALLVALPDAAAQMMVREFPAAVKRGVMTVGASSSQVSINGSVLRLAPGVRIRGPNNMLLQTGALMGLRLPVNYLQEPQGLVRDIWILNAAEEAVQPRGWDTVTNFVFESDADKPKLDDGKTPYNQLPGYPKKVP